MAIRSAERHVDKCFSPKYSARDSKKVVARALAPHPLRSKHLRPSKIRGKRALKRLEIFLNIFPFSLPQITFKIDLRNIEEIMANNRFESRNFLATPCASILITANNLPLFLTRKKDGISILRLICFKLTK